jgi:hypothetical protein
METKIASIIFLIISAGLSIRYFVDWKNNKAELNHWLGWACAFLWCLYCFLK